MSIHLKIIFVYHRTDTRSLYKLNTPKVKVHGCRQKRHIYGIRIQLQYIYTFTFHCNVQIKSSPGCGMF